jgi:hypothetical protein
LDLSALPSGRSSPSATPRPAARAGRAGILLSLTGRAPGLGVLAAQLRGGLPLGDARLEANFLAVPVDLCPNEPLIDAAITMPACGGGGVVGAVAVGWGHRGRG